MLYHDIFLATVAAGKVAILELSFSGSNISGIKTAFVVPCEVPPKTTILPLGRIIGSINFLPLFN